MKRLLLYAFVMAALVGCADKPVEEEKPIESLVGTYQGLSYTIEEYDDQRTVARFEGWNSTYVQVTFDGEYRVLVEGDFPRYSRLEELANPDEAEETIDRLERRFLK